MKIVIILLLIGLLAGFYPRSGKDSGTDAPGWRDKGAYLALSCVCMALGIMQQMKLFPVIADWMDDVMEVFFHIAGGKNA